MKRLKGISRFFFKIAQKKIIKIALSLKDDSQYKKILVDRINKRVDIPNLSEEQEAKIINTIIDSLIEFLLDVLNDDN